MKNLSRASFGAALATTAIAAGGTGAANAATLPAIGDPSPIKTTLGAIQPLTAADAKALYGTKAPPRAGAQASFRARGCRTARSSATYNRKVPLVGSKYRVFTLYWDSRFCWDKNRKRAVQRGPREARVNVSKKGIASGIEFTYGPEAAYSTRWHGAPKGMAVMRARFDQNDHGFPGGPGGAITYRYVTQHGHYDGTVYDTSYSKKGIG